MRIAIISFCFLILNSFICVEKAVAQDVHLKSQAEVNGFNTNITVIDGNLKIGQQNNPDPIMDLSNLSGLRSVEGDLNVEYNALLTNLVGLSSIEHVGGSVNILWNEKLTSIDLHDLDSVRGTLQIAVNHDLLSLAGFASLIYIEEDLLIKDNFYLPNLNGLEEITYIGRDISLELCSYLTSISGLSGITTVNQDLKLNGLFRLLSVDGFEGITGIGRHLIVENNALKNLYGFSQIQSVGGDVAFNYNFQLEDCHGLDCLLDPDGNVGGAISILGNDTGCESKSEILDASRCSDGFVFVDVDQNCRPDLITHGIAGRRAIIQPGNWLLESDDQGVIHLDNLQPGSYSMEVDTSGPWSAPCDVTRDFEISSGNNIVDIDPIPLTADSVCSMPGISMSMPFARPCKADQTISIKASNHALATDVLEDPYVILTLDPMLTFESASIPASQLDATRFRFELEDLEPGEERRIIVNVMVCCNVERGQSLISRTELFPVDSCVYDQIPPGLLSPFTSCDLPFDGSNLQVLGLCAGDSVFFEIKNITDNEMACYSHVRYYVDTELQWSDSILLAGNESQTFGFVADGRTLRMEADQHPLHPGLSRPNATVERCGDDANWTPGLVNDLYFDDADSFIDMACTEVSSSYDPNDKAGFPAGIKNEHRVLPNQPMEYLIRFQNTGNDTAFKIIVRDTLDIDLNLLSVNPGVSSHSYVFAFHPPRVLEWTFDNILLPDSNINEPASHGFLTFEILQNADLENGTMLDNKAAIYFDFNDPVLTNTTSHMVDDGIDGGTSSISHDLNRFSTFKAFPNPTTGLIEIIRDQQYPEGGVQLSVFDITGRKVDAKALFANGKIQLKLEANPGLYFIQVRFGFNNCETLKIIVQ